MVASNDEGSSEAREKSGFRDTSVQSRWQMPEPAAGGEEAEPGQWVLSGHRILGALKGRGRETI